MPRHCRIFLIRPSKRTHCWATRCNRWKCNPLHIPLPRALEEEPYNEHLQSRHTHHHQTLHNTEVKDPPFSAPDSAEIPVLSRAEIFLHSRDGRELARQLENRFFERGGLFRGRALFGWNRGSFFVLDLLFPHPSASVHCN